MRIFPLMIWLFNED